jgi:pimeloyl-ACP methyl ester carboxylesterase
LVPPSFLVPAPDSRVAYRERGSGPAVVFLHGGTGTGEYDWAFAAEHLADRYRTVVVDMRGHGETLDPTGEIGMTRFGLDLMHVIRALGLSRAVLVGFSAGGNTLLHFLSRDPSWATAIVTVGASAEGDATRVQEIMTGPWPRTLREMPHAGSKDNPNYWAELRNALARDWVKNLALDADALGRITCPALVVHGDNDLIQPLRYSERLAREIPNAEFALIENASHSAHLDHPEIFLAVLESFLERVTRR